MVTHEMNPNLNEKFEVDGLKFNVSMAKQIIKNREPNFQLPVEGAMRMFRDVEIRRRKAMNDSKVNPDVPVIVVTRRDSGGTHYFCIDGWHRLYKASRKKLKTVPAYRLTLGESARVQIL